jgi:hypothetical protein
MDQGTRNVIDEKSTGPQQEQNHKQCEKCAGFHCVPPQAILNFLCVPQFSFALVSGALGGFKLLLRAC